MDYVEYFDKKTKEIQNEAHEQADRLNLKSVERHNDSVDAFRHAYWCCLIMMYFCKVSSPEKSLKWCEKLTNMHEDLFPNKPLETKMDLHNNRVGMDYFMSLVPGIHRQFFESSFFIEELRKRTENAVLIRSVDEEVDENQLIYLE